MPNPWRSCPPCAARSACRCCRTKTQRYWLMPPSVRWHPPRCAAARVAHPLVKELLISAFSLGPAMLAVRDSRLSSFHGAEHKSVAGYETGRARPAAPRRHALRHHAPRAPGDHQRGSNMALRRAGAERSLSPCWPRAWSASAAPSSVAWMARHKGHPLAELLRKPGIQMQRMVTTAEPRADQLKVAQAAMAELLRLEGEPAPAESTALSPPRSAPDTPKAAPAADRSWSLWLSRARLRAGRGADAGGLVAPPLFVGLRHQFRHRRRPPIWSRATKPGTRSWCARPRRWTSPPPPLARRSP